MTLSTHIRERINASGPLEKNKLLLRAADEIDKLRAYIIEQGGFSDTCTKNILGVICDDCQCGEKK